LPRDGCARAPVHDEQHRRAPEGRRGPPPLLRRGVGGPGEGTRRRPVSIPFGEVYTALQRGVVDGAMTSATNAEPMKFFEVSKYLNYWFLTRASLEWLAVNQKAWDTLPNDLQQVVLDALKAVRFEGK